MKSFFIGMIITGIPLSVRAADIASSVALVIGPDKVVVGQKIGDAQKKYFMCEDNAIQHTVERCQMKPEALASVSSGGNSVAEVTVNVHFNGEIINMSVVYNEKVGFQQVLQTFKEKLKAVTKVEYWADSGHLYKSYIWIDNPCGQEKAGTEVELSRTVKGKVADSRVRVYISNLAGNRPIAPEDAEPRSAE